jgi:integrase
MGGRQRQPGQLVWPRGVTRREFDREERIQIAFSYMGVECRELQPPGKITQTAIDIAAGLRNEIRRKIDHAAKGLGTFVYSDYFPGSPRALQFGATGRRVMLADRLRLTEEAYEKQVANGNMSPSTLGGYKKAIHSERVTEFVKGRTIADVKPSELRAFMASVPGTAKHVRNLLTPLRQTFADALNDDLLQFDPFDRIDTTALLKKTTKDSDYEVDPFTEQEREQILLAARPDEAPTVRFWLNAGFRPGELIAFKWPKVDWANRRGRVDLNQVVGVEKLPKTAAGIRDVEFNDEAIASLIAQKSVSFEAGQHVFLNPRTGKAWTTDAQLRKTLWVPLLERAGVRYRNPYQCRHTFASRLLTQGHNPWYVADQLGHVDVAMVYRIYGKFIAQDYQKPKAQPTLRAV